MGIGKAALERFLVEWYEPYVPTSPIDETVKRLNDGAACVTALGERIRLLMVLAVPSDQYAFGVFAAESADVVARVCLDAGAPAERISATVGWVRSR
jgi:hypothetical protein